MRITETQLRALVREEMRRRCDLQLEGIVRRLNELYPGSNVGSWLKQAVTHMWEADKLMQRSLSELDDNDAWNAISQIHKMLEKLTYHAHDRMEAVVSNDVKGRDATGKKRPPPRPAPRRAA